MRPQVGELYAMPGDTPNFLTDLKEYDTQTNFKKTNKQKTD